MKASNLSRKSDVLPLVSTIQKAYGARLPMGVAALLILTASVAGSIYFSASVSASKGAGSKRSKAAVSKRTNALPVINFLGFSEASKNIKAMFFPQTIGPSIATYASDCMTPKTVFNVQDTDLTVCAKATGSTGGQMILWSNANFILVQSSTPNGNGESTFTLNANSSLGDWRVILYEPIGGNVYALTPFTVIDDQNPSADVAIVKGAGDDTVENGAQALFTVNVTNYGPSDAINVQVTDSVPANTTFSSFAPVSGPTGINCINPTAGAGSGDTICTIPTLARGETAVFAAAYDITGGSVITNSASATSETDDPRSFNNSSTAELQVTTPTTEICTLDCPTNVVVTANTTQDGQPGAVVTYAAATVNGNCGAVTNTPASGTFLPVGTHSIVSQSEIGGASCTFTVTVLDTNPPTITCPANITVTAAENATEATVDVGTPTINASGGGTVTAVRSDDTQAVFDDNGNVVTPAVIHSVTDPFPIGSTGITWTVTDAGGRRASCTQTVTVVAFGDRDPVTISCPPNVTVTASAGNCEATILASTIGTPTTVPSDSNVEVTPRRSDDRPLSDPFPAGISTITWTATDNTNGSVASCVQTITVNPASGADTTPPTLHVPGNVSVTTSTCSAVLDDELGVATAEDSGSCSTSNVNISRTGVPANFIFPTGTTTIVYTATDAAGNTATGVQLVTVTESPAVPPTITAPGDVTVFTGPGATSCGTLVSDATLGTATAADNCGAVTVTRTGVPAGNNFPVGNTTVTYRATDASGNFVEDTQIVTVIDNTPPAISCPANIILEPTCPTGAVATWTPPVGTDNCPGATTTQTAGGAPATVFAIGTTTVTYSVTDANGNGPVSCSFTVTVLTPQEVIQNLQAAVNASSLTGTQKNGLLAKLSAALQAINSGQTNVACNKLSDFVNSVENLVSRGNLPATTGTSWINSANNVRNAIGCTNLPCT